MTLFGWDASDFDHGRGPMNMGAARRDGIDFYTHKATEGTSTKHHPGPSLAAARAAGIPFLGCYLVPRSGPTVSSQVDYFLGWVNQQVPWWRQFPGWFWQVDTEHWGYDQVSAQRGHDVAQLLAQRTGKRVIHYAPKWAYGNSVPAGEPLWASAYVAGSGHYRALYPGDGSSRWGAYSGRVPAILQYSSSATIGGQRTCDANAFRGTLADFAALIGGTTPPPATTGGNTNGVHDMTLLRIKDGGDLTGAPEGNGAIYLATVAGPVHVGGVEYASISGASVIYVDSWARLLQLAPSAGAPSDAQIHQLGAVLAADLIGRPDTPLGEDDEPAIVEAVKRAARELLGAPTT